MTAWKDRPNQTKEPRMFSYFFMWMPSLVFEQAPDALFHPGDLPSTAPEGRVPPAVWRWRSPLGVL